MSVTLAPGGRLGNYEILDELGAGGMGHVFRARDLALDRIVALKTLAPELARDPGFVQRFQREARAVASLNHPNIVQIYAVGSVGDIHFLAMEFLDGRSLGHYLKNGHWPEGEAILIARQACQALAVAHAAGIVHRDIKPDNLILTGRGEVKLVDLGIAKKVDDEHSMTQTGSAVGTPHYISPEQVHGRRDLDGRADIYSLGATLYHLVTGHTPYTGSSGAHVMSMHLFAPLPDPRSFEPGLSDGLCRVLRKMLAKDREERYPDVQALDLDLYQLQIGRAPEPAEPSASAVAATFIEGAGALRPAATAFEPALLAGIEEALATAIGPMARVLVRRSARAAGSLEALCTELATHVEEGPERDGFLRRCRACADAPSGSGATPPTRSPTPATRAAASTPASASALGPGATVESRGRGRIAEGELTRIEGELAREIGPVARVLVRRAARTATTSAELVAELETHIPDQESRRSFRRAILGVD